jgi:trimethylamine--corrinoid protein Co-methyltransferase
MRDLQLAVRGTPEALRARPLCLFSCCPTAPLKWSFETSQNVIDAARAGVPVEFISMPLAGFVAPVTLVGSVVQHAAETLSGVVLSQLAAPGAPVVWGGSPAVFDIRYETTPMGAIETMMLDCANAEVGKRLSLPTQGYIALSDAKALDAQAGLETGIGATLAGLSGINSVSGPGMLDFESCQSLEKLVVDDEICGMVSRLRRGVEPRDDFPSRALFEELLRDGHLLIAAHTRKHRKEQLRMASSVIERAPLGRWREDGEPTLGQRAAAEVERRLAAWAPSRVADETKRALRDRMAHAAAAAGMAALPKVES